VTTARRGAPGRIPMLRLRSLLVVAMSLSVAAAARADEFCLHAGGPVWACNTITTSSRHLNLVGYRSGATGDAADSTLYLSKLTVTYHDYMNQPLGTVPVLLDLSGCTSDVRIATTQSYHGQITICEGETPEGGSTWARTIEGWTTGDGSVSFVVIGGLSGRVDHPAGCAKLWVASNYLGRYFMYVTTIDIAAYDQNGCCGFSLPDIAFLWSDLSSGSAHARSDLNGDGQMTLADIAYGWRAEATIGVFDRSPLIVCP
jgi:hypothetical protein